jgi:hypothetical protein
VLATTSSPMLAPSSVDLFFICNTIHHIGARDELCVIKTRPRVKSETCRPYALLEISELERQTATYAPCSRLPRLSWRARAPGARSPTSRPRARKSGATTAADRAQEEALSTTARRHGPSLLGSATKLLAPMGVAPTHRQRRHRDPVESRSVPTILDSPLPQAPSRPAADGPRDSPPHSDNGVRWMGCAAYPR